MKESIVVYPIVITHNQENSKNTPSFLVYIPDLDGYTEGFSVPDAIDMAIDYIGTNSLESEALPASNYTLPKAKKNEIVTLVKVNIAEYKRRFDKKIIKKTITIPNYLNELGKEKSINFSETLTEALKQKLHV